MVRESAFWIEEGRSLHQPGTVNENVLESDWLYIHTVHVNILHICMHIYIYTHIYYAYYTSLYGEETRWHYSVFVIYSFMSDKEEEDQTANVDTDVLGQFWHKKSEKEKRWKWNVERRNEEAKQEKIQETNRKPELWNYFSDSFLLDGESFLRPESHQTVGCPLTSHVFPAWLKAFIPFREITADHLSIFSRLHNSFLRE